MRLHNKFLNCFFVVIIFSMQIVGQMQKVPVPAQQNNTAAKTPTKVVTPIPKVNQPVEDNTWWYLTLLVLGLGLAGAVVWWVKEKGKSKEPVSEKSPKEKKKLESERGTVDSEKELEWLRKNKDIIDKRRKKVSKNIKEALPNSQILAKNNGSSEVVINYDVKGVQLASNSDLPIFGITELELSNPFQPLPLSNDEALLGAIEQINDEFEEDEQIRDLAVRILTMFKNRNSVEALSQVALYDLASNLRVKALISLAEFDHESVFETVLLACADPTREVRAAAARALSKLTFNRADAWARIIESGEEWRMVAAARAAIESGFVERSFDRLIHNDYKQAYEAFSLVTLLLEANETELIMKVLEEAKDERVKKAVLHTIKVNGSENMLPFLNKLATLPNLRKEFSEYLDETIYQIGGDFAQV